MHQGRIGQMAEALAEAELEQVDGDGAEAGLVELALPGAAGQLAQRQAEEEAHRAVAKGFLDRGFHLGHVTGHSIGMTMIEFPKIGEHDDTELQANMVLSMHPHAISQDGKTCLYMQDTWLVTPDGGVPLADLPMKIYDGTETR